MRSIIVKISEIWIIVKISEINYCHSMSHIFQSQYVTHIYLLYRITENQSDFSTPCPCLRRRLGRAITTIALQNRCATPTVALYLWHHPHNVITKARFPLGEFVRATRKQEFSNVICCRSSELFRQPITLLNSCFRFASREQIRLVENGLYVIITLSWSWWRHPHNVITNVILIMVTSSS